jgi:hypothetical protein
MSIWFLFCFSSYIESWPFFVLQSRILTQQKYRRKNTDTVPDNAEYNWFHKWNCASPIVSYDLKLTKHHTQAHLLLSSCTARLKGDLVSSSTRFNPSSYDLKLTKHNTQAHLLLSSCTARLKGHLVSSSTRFNPSSRSEIKLRLWTCENETQYSFRSRNTCQILQRKRVWPCTKIITPYCNIWMYTQNKNQKHSGEYRTMHRCLNLNMALDGRVHGQGSEQIARRRSSQRDRDVQGTALAAAIAEAPNCNPLVERHGEHLRADGFHINTLIPSPPWESSGATPFPGIPDR